MLIAKELSSQATGIIESYAYAVRQTVLSAYRYFVTFRYNAFYWYTTKNLVP